MEQARSAGGGVRTREGEACAEDARRVEGGGV